jgi:hypothetical protein
LYHKELLLLILLITTSIGWSQSPHGDKLRFDCAKCHNPVNWTYDKLHSSFDHNDTDFPLKGQHNKLECRTCHESLQFEKTESNCYTCHNDIHQQTVGNDCARCHNGISWVVENITKMHEQTSFPLMGVHSIVNCDACHQSETNLRFSPINPECISCHLNDYASAKMPDHSGQNFPTDCTLCHRITGTDWKADGIVHSFFPLEQGHNISDCTKCHVTPIYADTRPECINCHRADFQNAKNPDHALFPQECNLCHTLAIGWMPASFSDHDSRFPIYTGNHKGEWDLCIDCHTTAGDYNTFSCIQCHEHNNASKLAKEHDEVGGYQFVSTACFGCHPKGN